MLRDKHSEFALSVVLQIITKKVGFFGYGRVGPAPHIHRWIRLDYFLNEFVYKLSFVIFPHEFSNLLRSDRLLSSVQIPALHKALLQLHWRHNSVLLLQRLKASSQYQEQMKDEQR